MDPSKDFTISQASSFLGVSTRTVHKYIRKRLLRASKWNRVWLIENQSVMDTRALLDKIHGHSQHSESDPNEQGVRLSYSANLTREKYDSLLKQAGQLREAESLLAEYRTENADLKKKVQVLEWELARLRPRRHGVWAWLSRFIHNKRIEG